MTSLDTKLALFDWSEEGILKATTHPIVPGLDEAEEYLAGIETMIQSVDGPYVIFVDGRQSKRFNSQVRTRIAVGGNALQAKYEGRTQGSYVVVENTLVKMTLMGINLILKYQSPQQIYTSYDKALADARAKMAEVNAHSPTSRRL